MTTRKQILVVDDEADLVELVTFNLERAGYGVLTAGNGRLGLALATSEKPDLILLDIMMPELNGIEVASRLRANPDTSGIPIIMLTAKGEEVDELVGLRVGADDYLAKPCNTKILLARVEAVLRRAGPQPIAQNAGISLGPIQIDTDSHEASVEGEPLKLTLTEFRVLTSLLEADGRVLSRSSLIQQAIGPGITVTERTIDVHVTAIRKKLGQHAGIIQTVRGVGYRATLAKDESVGSA